MMKPHRLGNLENSSALSCFSLMTAEGDHLQEVTGIEE